MQIDELRNGFGKTINGLRAEIEHLNEQNGATQSRPVFPEASSEQQVLTPATDERKGCLLDLLDSFFNKYAGSFFNVQRILRWDAERRGFRELGGYKDKEIEQAIYDLIAARKLDTVIGHSGRTLYGRSRKRRD